MTAAETIKQRLKKSGFKQTQVSVKGSTSIKVTIRDVAVDFALVKEIASAQEHISRDHATGEILCGGNTFVEVLYAEDLVEKLAKPHLAKIEEAITAGRDYVLGTWEDGYLVSKSDVRDSLVIWKLADRCGSHVSECWRPADAATSLARVLLQAGRLALLTGGGVA